MRAFYVSDGGVAVSTSSISELVRDPPTEEQAAGYSGNRAEERQRKRTGKKNRRRARQIIMVGR